MAMTPEELEAAQARIEQRKREIVASENARETASLKGTMASIMAMAERATGLTTDQMRTMAVEEAIPDRQPEDRSVMVARGIPEIHLRHVFDQEPVQCDALEHVKAFLGSQETLLVLSGGVGTRKSGSASWGLTRRPGRYVTADDLGRLAAARDEEGQVEYRKVKKASLLVIDDLGGEYLDDKGWFFKVLNGLIDHRYAACLRTVLTTNLTPEEFRRSYGERITDRLRQVGAFIEVGGKSVRRRA